MICKTIEIRDKGTFVPALAVKLTPSNEQDRYLLARCGFGLKPEEQSSFVLLMGLQSHPERVTYDPFDWGNNRSRLLAHNWLLEHFDEIESGAVVDVEYILGESNAPKASEATECPI